MQPRKHCKNYWALAWGLVGLGLLGSAVPVQAQSSGGSRSGGSTSGGSSSLGGSSSAGGSSMGSSSLGSSSSSGGFSGSSSIGFSGSSSTGGSSTLGFSGSSSGGFSGSSSGGFSGSSSGGFSGSSYGGGGGSGGGFIGGSTSTGPTTSNPFRTNYVNPMSMGLVNSNSKTFGSPLYSTTTSSSSLSRTNTLGTTSRGYGSTLGGGLGSSTQYTRRPTAYVVIPDLGAQPASPSRLQTDLQRVVAGSSALTSKGDIQVVTDDSGVVLRGIVANDHERRLAEALLRLTPGVRDIRNELAVRPSASPAGNSP
jgi:hypothetical protein